MKSLFTIDFEDFKNDFLVKNKGDGNYNYDALIKSYKKIQNLIISSKGEKKCTFFCTGNVAKEFPEIIKEIANDGHEIACHSYQHVDMSKLSNYEFEQDLENAIKHLNNASGQEIKGYRAPMYSLPKDDIEKYQILEKYLQYDSSLVVKDNEISKYINNGKYKGTNLKVLPIFAVDTLFLTKKIIGGTYLKITSQADVVSFFHEAAKNKIFPVIYMHPYEFDNDKDFWVSYNDMKSTKLNPVEKIYYQIRQHQWHSFNKNTLKKLTFLLDRFPNQGRVDEYLEIK